MIEIGKTNSLRVVKEVDFGIYLDGGDQGEILMPKRYVPAGTEPDDFLDVFIYLDSEDRLIATNEEPHAEVDDFAYLKCVQTSQHGAFLDWGLMKDLFVPFREQSNKMQSGLSYFVRVYLDEETNRIVASSKTRQFLDNRPIDFQEGEEVDLIIAGQTDLGYWVVINDSFTGLIYENEVFQPLKPGQKCKGFIKKIREDEKVDVALQQSGYDRIEGVANDILQKLEGSGGFLEINDKSSPETIKHVFGISKKAFKKAIGGLYRERMITIEKDGIRLKR